jgi:hypothetical protein
MPPSATIQCNLSTLKEFMVWACGFMTRCDVVFMHAYSEQPWLRMGAKRVRSLHCFWSESDVLVLEMGWVIPCSKSCASIAHGLDRNCIMTFGLYAVTTRFYQECGAIVEETPNHAVSHSDCSNSRQHRWWGTFRFYLYRNTDGIQYRPCKLSK